MTRIVNGDLVLSESRSDDASMVERLRTEFTKDKLKKVLIQHRLRLCTLSKKEYVRTVNVSKVIRLYL